jgi:tetratricopeptide (TPR) repeat protein
MNAGGMNAPDYRMLIMRFMDSGQWDRALESAREWLSVDPHNSRAHLTAGQALLNLKRYAEAEPHLRAVLASEPNSGTAHRFLSLSLFNTKRFKEADEAMQRAISLAPHDHYNWYNLAWMFYRQGDFASAIKYAEKARELNPLDSDVINLLGLCSPHNPAAGKDRLLQYEAALALDPENAEVHNNIGVLRLHAKDYPAAEEAFRRALFFSPSLKVARNNLFLALKHRDAVYRILCLPRDWLLKAFTFMSQARRKSIWLYVLMLPVWLLTFRFFLGGLVLWCLLIWPMVKVYEFLTVGDIRARAGEIGSRSGGLLGYRKWPVRVRLSIFAGALIAFWAGLAWVFTYGISSVDRNDTVALVGGLAIAGVLFFFVFIQLRAMVRNSRAKAHARKRAKRMAGLLKPEMESE